MNSQVKKYVAYYRVSTEKQGKSKLGLSAQKTQVEDFISVGDLLTAEYVEIESGKNNDRPNLIKAVEHAKKTDAVLIIAKLDRLSRNIGFIFMLKEAGVEFVACDLPEMNTLNLGIFATIAQYEREIISQRTKVALQAKKDAGFRLGTPANLGDSARKKSIEIRQRNAANNSNNKKAFALIESLRNQKISYKKIADKLNEYGFQTRNNKEFKAMTVKLIYDRFSSVL